MSAEAPTPQPLNNEVIGQPVQAPDEIKRGIGHRVLSRLRISDEDLHHAGVLRTRESRDAVQKARSLSPDPDTAVHELMEMEVSGAEKALIRAKHPNIKSNIHRQH